MVITALSFGPKELARRLITRGSGKPAAGSESPSEAALGAMFRTLARWFGVEGTRALFTRALVIAKSEHPGLEPIRVRDSEPYFDGIATKAKANGDATTSEALEALILTVIELLDRQIGPDLTMRLIDPDTEETGGNDK